MKPGRWARRAGKTLGRSPTVTATVCLRSGEQNSAHVMLMTSSAAEIPTSVFMIPVRPPPELFSSYTLPFRWQAPPTSASKKPHRLLPCDPLAARGMSGPDPPDTVAVEWLLKYLEKMNFLRLAWKKEWSLLACSYISGVVRSHVPPCSPGRGAAVGLGRLETGQSPELPLHVTAGSGSAASRFRSPAHRVGFSVLNIADEGSLDLKMGHWTAFALTGTIKHCETLNVIKFKIFLLVFPMVFPSLPRSTTHTSHKI